MSEIADDSSKISVVVSGGKEAARMGIWGCCKWNVSRSGIWGSDDSECSSRKPTVSCAKGVWPDGMEQVNPVWLCIMKGRGKC